MTKSSDRSTVKRALATGLVSAASLLALPAVASATEFVCPDRHRLRRLLPSPPASTSSRPSTTRPSARPSQVAAGTYDTEPGNQVFINKGLVLTGAGIGQTILDGNGVHSPRAARHAQHPDRHHRRGHRQRADGPRARDHHPRTTPATAMPTTGSSPRGRRRQARPPTPSNGIRVEGAGAGGRDYNLYSVGDNSNLVVTNSQFTGADFNPILLERHQGPSDFNGNTITKSAGTAASGAYFDMNYSGAIPGNPTGVAGTTRFRNNIVVTNGNGGPSFNARPRRQRRRRLHLDRRQRQHDQRLRRRQHRHQRQQRRRQPGHRLADRQRDRQRQLAHRSRAASASASAASSPASTVKQQPGAPASPAASS